MECVWCLPLVIISSLQDENSRRPQISSRKWTQTYNATQLLSTIAVSDESGNDRELSLTLPTLNSSTFQRFQVPYEPWLPHQTDRFISGGVRPSRPLLVSYRDVRHSKHISLYLKEKYHLKAVTHKKITICYNVSKFLKK